MLYLILAIISSAMITILMRLASQKCEQNFSMLAANYLVCSLIAYCYIGVKNVPSSDGLGLTLPFGIVTGAVYLLGFFLMQLNVRRNGVVMTAIFGKLGVLVPIIVSVAAFHERPEVLQVVGFLVAIGSMILINLEKGQQAVTFKLGLILLLLTGGGSDVASKLFKELGNPDHSNLFLLLIFLSALVMSLVFVLVRKERPSKVQVVYGLLIGVPNYFSARFLLRSLSSVPAVIAYPTYSVGTIVLITMAGLLFFHEKLSRRQMCALGGILVSLVLLNI